MSSRPEDRKKRPGPVRGELALIEYIRRRASRKGARPGAELRLGIGDDCAILRPRTGEEIVVTTDLSLENRHFRRDWHSARSVGHRALARGLSDLAAMGARPIAAFLSLAIPKSLVKDGVWLQQFFDGLLDLADTSHVPLAGGDTAEAPGDQVLADIVLLGAIAQGRALRRDGARAGEKLFCTGALGGAAAELRSLASPPAAPGAAAVRGHTVPLRGSKEESPHPHLFPEPRLAAGRALVGRSLATAAIDLSDGLSTDLRHLCEASGVAAEVEAARLPLHSLAVALGPEQALHLALNGGEDYELLFTAPADARIPRRLGSVPITEIGRVLPRRKGRPLVTLVDVQGSRSEMVASGWEHLK